MRATVQVARGPDAQAALDQWRARPAAGRRALVIEGAFDPLVVPADLPVLRLAAGCVCCLGQVPLRVGLVRLLRAERPAELLLLLASDAHLPRVRALLADGSLGVACEVDSLVDC
jgi:G3E family GTPase